MPALDLDTLIRRIRAEADKLDLPKLPEPQLHSLGKPNLVPIDRLPESPWAALRNRVRWHVADFLLVDNAEFLEALYNAVLRRPADEGGLKHYQREMVGGKSRLEMLCLFLRSPEAGQQGVQIAGLPRITWLVFALHRKLGRFGVRRITEKLFDLIARNILAHHSGYQFALSRMLYRHMGAAEAKLGSHEQNLVDHQNRHTETCLRLDQIDVETRRIDSDIIVNREQFMRLRREDERLMRQLADPALVAAAPNSARHQAIAAQLEARLDAYYLAFEDANRGSREEIRAKLTTYLPCLEPIKAISTDCPVLDIGCGRGEWLTLLRENGIRGIGIDANPHMAETCREQGLDVRCEDALTALSAMADNSLGAVTGFHIIEHLEFPILYEIVNQAARVLRPGGLILFETPNPENPLVGSHTFYHDFTHRNPVTPAGIGFLVKYHNLVDIEILRRNPYPPEARLPGSDLTTERINALLCGYQDYAVLARKPVVEVES